MQLKTTLNFLFILFFTISYADGNDLKFVNNGAQMLDFDTGARASSLGGAYVGVADDPNTIFYNTAGLANLKAINISVSHFSLFQELAIQSFSGNYPLKYGVIGMGINYFHTGEFAQIINGAQSGSTISYSSLISEIGYGISVIKNLKAGVGIKLIYNNIADITGSSIAADLGVLYSKEIYKFYNKVEDNFKAGISFQNFGTKIKYKEKEEDLPQKIRAGIYYKPLKYAAVTIEENYWLGYDFEDGLLTKIGVELLPEYFITPRIGINFDKNNFEFSTGLGIGVKMNKYQYMFNTGYIGNNILGSSLYFTLTIKPQLLQMYRKQVLLSPNILSELPTNKETDLYFGSFQNESVSISIEYNRDFKDKELLSELSKKLQNKLSFYNLKIKNKNSDVKLSLNLKKNNKKYSVFTVIQDTRSKKTLKEIKIKFKSKKIITKLTDILAGKINSVINENYYTPVKIFSIPDKADVFLNEKKAGKTPFIGSVKKDNYNLKLISDGYKPLIKTITINNSNNNFGFVLKRLYKHPGKFNIKFTVTSTNETILEQAEALKFMLTDELSKNKNYRLNINKNYDIVVKFSFPQENKIKISLIDINKNKVFYNSIFPFSQSTASKTFPDIVNKVSSTLNSYAGTISARYLPIYKKYRYGYLKLFTPDKNLKYKIEEFDEIYKQNETVKLRQKYYNISILNKKNKPEFKTRILLIGGKTNTINYFPLYTDNFKDLKYGFWEEILIFKHKNLKSGIFSLDSYNKKRALLSSVKLPPAEFSCSVKFKIKKGKNFYFIISDDNFNTFIKYDKKGYYFVKKAKWNNNKTKAVMLTLFKNEKKVYHKMYIKHKDNKIVGYIDNIKITEYEYTPKRYIKIKLMTKRSSVYLKDFYFKYK